MSEASNKVIDSVVKIANALDNDVSKFLDSDLEKMPKTITEQVESLAAEFGLSPVFTLAIVSNFFNNHNDIVIKRGRNGGLYRKRA